ncbi:MAG: hypothetical protein WCS65_14170 [Verrucomicrobiae bacterium]
MAALIITGSWVRAGDDGSNTNARIEISGGEEIQLTPVSAPEFGSLKNFVRRGGEVEGGLEFNLLGETGPLPEDEWVKASFSFLPKSDGKVTLYLKGNWAKAPDGEKLSPRWVYYDKVTVEGAESFQNGDFEEASDGKPKIWKMTSDARYITSGIKPLSGDAMVAVWLNQNCQQTFPVSADQKVTITIHVKKANIQ